MKRHLLPVALSIAAVFITGCRHHQNMPQPTAAPPTPAALAAHTEEFRKGVVKVADGVYSAIGYGIANSILLVGQDGVIVVDTLESAEAAREVLAEFRKITDLPVRAIIYTHSHPDHIGGAGVFGGRGTPVYAQEDVSANMDKLASILQPIITKRSARMYGVGLPAGEFVNLGIGGTLGLKEGATISVLRPTRTFRDSLDDTVAGIHFQLVHAPGETEDQLFVWLPERKVLLCGDNFYKAFPNLYTIRGTSYRSPRLWADSLDKMRALHADYLVPSHTRPIAGAAAIDQALTDYRDAIRYVYDQSIRHINQGELPDEVANEIHLPPQLAASPYLQEFYGKASWSAKTTFDGNLGWFSGDPADLQPLPPQEEAQRMAELAGGESALAAKAATAEQQNQHQWALQLSGYALRVNPQDEAARQTRIAALRAMGGAETNPPARDYYFVSAHELAGDLTLPKRIATPTPEMLTAMPLSSFFDGMSVNLRAEDCLDKTVKVGFDFSGDGGAPYTYIIRRGASEVVPGIAPDADIVVKVPLQVFKEMLAQLRNPALTIAKDFEVTKGNKLEFARFMQLFQPG